MRMSLYESPLGAMVMGSDGECLISLSFGDGIEGKEEDLPVFAEARLWLDTYFSGRVPSFTPPLRLEGTPFRKRVWERLLDIPYGTTVSYGELSRKLGIGSAQAVGGAVGHNPIAIIVPCHRVIGSDGSLTGYHGGLERKAGLLSLEGINASLPRPSSSRQGCLS